MWVLCEFSANSDALYLSITFSSIHHLFGFGIKRQFANYQRLFESLPDTLFSIINTPSFRIFYVIGDQCGSQLLVFII
jgi:hypothetical protein